MKRTIVLGTFAAACIAAQAETILWHHFDERAPGETALPTDTFVNAVSSDYGSGSAHSISENTALGTNAEFMPKFAAVPYSELGDVIYDPATGIKLQNRSSISFRTEGTTSALKGGAVILTNTYQVPLTNFTVECFVCTTGGTFNTIAPIVGMVNTRGFMNETWQIGLLTNGRLFMRFNEQPSSTSGQGTAVINDGKWHHLALICSYDKAANQSKYYMYVDYRLDFTRDNAGPINYRGDIYIGGYKHTGRKFNGAIDELRISDTVLRPSQFLRRFSPFVDEDTIAYLPFEGTPDTAPYLRHANYAVRDKGNTVFVGYASFVTTNAVFSSDVYSKTLRDNVLVPPPATNNTSLFFKTNGVLGTGSGLYLYPYEYTATNFTAELFFKAEGKITWNSDSHYSQTLLKFSGDPPIQLTLDAAHPGTMILVCHNGYGRDTFKWENCGNYGKNLDDGRWHHVAVAYDADNHTLTLYLDYKQERVVQNVKLSGAAYNAFIGHGGDSLKQFFHGKIDSVRFVQRVLSLDELLSPSSIVYQGPDDVVFHAPLNDSFEAVAPSWYTTTTIAKSRGYEGCEDPVFTESVKYSELLLDGKDGSCSITNTGSLKVNGSLVSFSNTERLGIFDHTTEFFFRLSTVGSMAGIIRINNDSTAPDAAPIWALYTSGQGINRLLSLRCSTVTNGVVSTERYLSSKVYLTNLEDEEWHHFAMTTRYDEESGRQHFAIFIDGEQKWTDSLLGYLYDRGNGHNVTLGYSIEKGGNVVGNFDEIRITRGVLPPSRFLCRYRKPRGTVVTIR